MRLIASVFALAAFAAAAQTAPLTQETAPPEPRKNQKIERIHVEDDAVKIDEVRYAGQTQSTTVTPKSGLPAYEILPANPARSRAGDERRNSSGGERVWNVFNF
jgi:hypothetical protein